MKNGRNSRLTRDQNLQIDYVCAACERAWKTGRIPAIDSMLAESSDAVRRHILMEMAGENQETTGCRLPNTTGRTCEMEWCFEPNARAPDFVGTGPLRGGSFNRTIPQTQSFCLSSIHLACSCHCAVFFEWTVMPAGPASGARPIANMKSGCCSETTSAKAVAEKQHSVAAPQQLGVETRHHLDSDNVSA